jgi:hypothetical protein
MKTSLILLVAVTGFLNTTFMQQNSKLDKWDWLIGEWKDTDPHKSGTEGSSFSFTFDLDKKIIVRKSNSSNIDITGRYKFFHKDLMIIYPDQTGKTDKAIYFDNEGHIINYRISFEGRSVIFKNYDMGNNPEYRLTYTRIDNQTINRKFELSRDRENFTTYEQGTSIKLK